MSAVLRMGRVDDRLWTRAVHNRKLRKQNTMSTEQPWLEKIPINTEDGADNNDCGQCDYRRKVMGMTTVFEWLRKRNRSVATAAVTPLPLLHPPAAFKAPEVTTPPPPSPLCFWG